MNENNGGMNKIKLAPELRNRVGRGEPTYYPHFYREYQDKLNNTCLVANVLVLAYQFYSIMALALCIKPQFGVHSHDKFMRDFEEYRNDFNSHVAKMFYDYIALICLGEMRHGAENSDFELDIECFNSKGRDDIWFGRRDWSADSVLRMAKDFFNEFKNPWRRGYGGNKWRMIAEGGLKYGKVADEVFIDYCFDLEHNNCYIFDKGGYMFYLPSKHELKDFLDYKRNLKETWRLLAYAQTWELQEFVSRAANIGLLKVDSAYDFYTGECIPSIIIFKQNHHHVHFNSTSNAGFYFNHYYTDWDRAMKEVSKLQIDEFIRTYHTWPWGNKDMTMEEVKPTGYNFIDGEDKYQRYDNEDYYEEDDNHYHFKKSSGY